MRLSLCPSPPALPAPQKHPSQRKAGGPNTQMLRWETWRPPSQAGHSCSHIPSGSGLYAPGLIWGALLPAPTPGPETPTRVERGLLRVATKACFHTALLPACLPLEPVSMATVLFSLRVPPSRWGISPSRTHLASPPPQPLGMLPAPSSLVMLTSNKRKQDSGWGANGMLALSGVPIMDISEDLSPVSVKAFSAPCWQLDSSLR